MAGRKAHVACGSKAISLKWFQSSEKRNAFHWKVFIRLNEPSFLTKATSVIGAAVNRETCSETIERLLQWASSFGISRSFRISRRCTRRDPNEVNNKLWAILIYLARPETARHASSSYRWSREELLRPFNFGSLSVEKSSTGHLFTRLDALSVCWFSGWDGLVGHWKIILFSNAF